MHPVIWYISCFANLLFQPFATPYHIEMARVGSTRTPVFKRGAYQPLIKL
jgi:hypothetical protein